MLETATHWLKSLHDSTTVQSDHSGVAATLPVLLRLVSGVASALGVLRSASSGSHVGSRSPRFSVEMWLVACGTVVSRLDSGI